MPLFSQNLPAAPLPPDDVLLCVRTGKIKPLETGSVKSAIDKSPCEGKIFLTPTGLVGDEQYYVLHGGVDKALHQYDASHYPTWNQEVPECSDLFHIGGYGENISTTHLHESNVCIGDIFQIGDEAFVQISEPRQPCYKLNRRFRFPKASIRTQQTGRTGWYLRVLQQGYIQRGDKMKLVKRINPTWSIKQIQKYLYDDLTNQEALVELSDLPGLGKEILGLFRDRLARGTEDMSFRLVGKIAPTVKWKQYRIKCKASLTPRVAAFHLETLNGSGSTFPDFANVLIRFGPFPQFIRAYSVVHCDNSTIELAIAREEPSRGGSVYLHDKAKVGDVLDVAQGNPSVGPMQFLKADGKHIFIIGGIGVTAFLQAILHLQAIGADVKVHYAVRSRLETPYLSVLPENKTIVYSKYDGERLNPKEVIPPSSNSVNGSVKIYCCGPRSLMMETRELVLDRGYPSDQTYFESFGVPSFPLGDPFEAKVKKTGKVLQVPSEKSLLQVLGEAGFDVPSGCLNGNCGTCMIPYSEGSVCHRGIALPEEDRCENMLSCTSRGEGRITIDVTEL
ncbi:pyruvate kinase-like protein [Aspergillus ambiguus]|uniref:pyruvate kinase-like protein n=1 Tax=Aspergillus ambiguus TaxID=176160 RepID=UPI003CCDE9A0